MLYIPILYNIEHMFIDMHILQTMGDINICWCCTDFEDPIFCSYHSISVHLHCAMQRCSCHTAVQCVVNWPCKYSLLHSHWESLRVTKPPHMTYIYDIYMTYVLAALHCEHCMCIVPLWTVPYGCAIYMAFIVLSGFHISYQHMLYVIYSNII